ncbi:hypothetical protein [Cytophaga aurantiaca]|uniref:hypothetical protein n=1 Tax=Cytophaga aurantiaca TaxID=29530 RepID=UPI00036DF2EC|nr:hypothetical protein [Cytophaga aurantiaca]
MKLLLKSTSIIEGLTGLALIFIPNVLTNLLLGHSITEVSGLILSMVGGSALLSIAIVCWLISESANAQALVKGLMFYNIAVVGIVLYSSIHFSVNNIIFFTIAGFHFVYGTWCLIIIRKTT